MMVGAAMVSATLFSATAAEPEVLEKLVVDKIWPGVPVRYCLLTYDDTQYVAYYNADRRTVVAQRKLGESSFTKKVLSSESDKPPRHSKQTSTIQGWDAHNYLTLAVDKAGHIHLSGNMHGDPLLYFRSDTPGDITSLKQVKSMVGRAENRVTYPKFMKGPEGDLVFKYRHGGSGNGIWYYNIYDAKTKTWKRLFDKPLLGGKGRNAYGSAPRRGPDGRYHMFWMWRETGNCNTNHDISYARSKDFLHWETVSGKKLELPITFADKGTIVDPVPVKGGLLNMGNGMGFDSKDRVVITYCKYDKDGNNQGYAARFENGKWMIRQITDWDHRWHFHGGGAIACKVKVLTPRIHGPGRLAVPYEHREYGNGLLILEEETLERLGTEPKPQRYPEALTTVSTDFPGMQVNWFGDIGSSPNHQGRYVLRWETLGPNRDRPRRGKLPENGELVLYRIGSGDGQ